ncbi:unnamed protein product [Didymodactylos carnosus]|uniref:Kinesin-like protein n=1 Tax=Didymodactylos carnosus TaxID=1234261 RepID=A0A813VAX7_9BILA|nr:unnamed protein product [Didymodactylos carnosus]CAF3630005.1 unnamed protein product [Didymodactylos carnosus]
MKKTAATRDAALNRETGSPVEVFCRLRPPPEGESETCIKVSSATELVLFSPEGLRNGIIKESHYEFSHILTDRVTQQAAFKELCLPLIDDLIQGKSSVLFTYGITGSGKTFTMMGPLNNPGLIPRSFDVLFNTVGNLLGKKFLLRSDRQNGYEILSEYDIITERSRKEIFTKNQRIKPDIITSQQQQVQRTLDTTQLSNFNQNCLYFVFVTFVEVYNNYIYDLFDDDILNKAPQSKQLREDARGRPYIKDVKEIEVRSSEEAIELLNIGLKRRRIAHTQLNTESSRSHSVLSLRLVQFQADIPPTSLTREDLMVSQIHLVDLAGSERVNRAKTAGDRVKEAGNINSSLMVLRQCFEILRENQAQGINKMVPYRDAKLTSFFKSYFDGEGKIRMILCVNPAVDGYEEIQHALKFGDLTKDVIVPRAPAPIPLRNRNILREIANNGPDAVPNQSPSPMVFQEFHSTALIAPFPRLEYSIETDEDPINNLQDHLTKRIEERRRLTIIHEQEEYLRKYILELSMEYDQCLIEHDELRKENEQQSKTIKHLQTRIKLLEKSQNDYVKTNSNYERDIRTLKSQMEEKMNEIKQLKADRRKDKNDFENKMRVKIMDVEQQHLNELRNKELQMKELERQHEDKLNIIRSMASGMCDQTTSTTTTRIAHAEFAQIQTNVQVYDIENNNHPTATQSLDMIDRIQQYNRVEMILPRSTPIEQIPIIHSDCQGPVVAHPRQQHRRSRSTKTLLQPQFSKKLGGQQPEKDDIGRTTKYVLTHQNLDSNGEVVTDLVKGDVLHSVGGGVNVIFNDIERLTCQSPPNPLVIKKRAKSAERLLQETRTPKSSSRQPPEVPPKRFRI